MARPGTKRALLDEIGIEAICARVENGETQREIASDIGITAGELAVWMNKPAHAERSARARSISAEAWLDRGLDAMMTAESDPSEIARARAIEQHCARRAAIRNPQYRDKAAPEESVTKTQINIDPTTMAKLSEDELKAMFDLLGKLG